MDSNEGMRRSGSLLVSVPAVDRIDVLTEHSYRVTFSDGLAVRFDVPAGTNVLGANVEPDPFMRGGYGDPRPLVAAVLAVHDARAALRGEPPAAVAPIAVAGASALIDRAIQFSRDGQLENLGTLIDWPLSGAAQVFIGLTTLPEQSRSRVVHSGLAELDAARSAPSMTNEVLAGLAAALAEVHEVVPVPTDRCFEARTPWRLPPSPPGLTDEQRDRLDSLRHEVADLTALFEVRGASGTLTVAVTADGGSLVVPLGALTG